MTEKISIDQLLSRNEAIQATHQSPPTFAEMTAHGGPPHITAIVSCMDPRADPGYFFKLVPGEAAIFRSVGGQVLPLLNDIISSDTLLNFDQLIIVHHTDCGALRIDPENVKRIVKERNPELLGIEKQHWSGIKIKDLEASVKQDVELIKGSKIVRDSLRRNVKGYLYNIMDAKLTLIAQ